MNPVFAEIVGWEFLLVLLIVLLVFGSAKLPGLARSLGSAAKEFRAGAAESEDSGDEHPGDSPKE
jgi:sec-independent protein translocase protein TatA